MGLFSKSSVGRPQKPSGIFQSKRESSSGQIIDPPRFLGRTPVQRAARVPESITGPPSMIGTDDDCDNESDASNVSDKTIELFRPRSDNGSSARSKTNRANQFEEAMRSLAAAQYTAQLRPRKFGAHMSSVGLSSIIDDDKSELDSLLGSLGDVLSRAKRGGRYKGTGFHVLHTAAANGRLLQIKALLSKGVLVDVRESDGWTPLMLAAQNGHVEAVRELLNNKADINAQGHNDVTALFQAVLNGKLDVVQLLCEQGADASLEPNDMMGLMVAAVYRGVAGKLGQDHELSPETISQMLRLLLRAKANPHGVDEDGDTALHLACLHGDAEWVRILLDANTNPNVVNKTGRTPLTNAAYESNAEMVQMLLEKGARPDIAEADQWTPLHMATQFLKTDTLKTVKLLVGAGADVNSRTKTNATALLIAAQHGDLDILQYLIDVGAIVDAQTSDGRTPLFQTVANGHIEAVDLLARAGANVNAVETGALKLRPLHYAAAKCSARMVERLIDLGADVNLLTAVGAQAPLQLAAMRNDDEGDKIFTLLLDRGATVS
ncbi:hypothetical protein PV04_07173 [Phialophora macrospora]|uniref:Uncharacterized protein n=1 Tax=Phialophora macrospora TaxID=1851006 RepID=A0A0D2FY89_9EURO|nr:hypothetical protein PV04_07173 [Phialophora macrospora]